MSRRVLLIYNPRAGKGRFLNALPNVIDLLTKADFAVEVYPTQGPGDAVRRIRSLKEDEYKLIIPAGGDGTIDEVFTGLLTGGLDIPVGYIPVGSTNDYAASLGIPSDINEAVKHIIRGDTRRVDAGFFNHSHIFVYVAAFGAFTDVAYATDQNLKNMFGHLAYLFEATKRLMDLQSYRVRVKTRELELENDYIFGMVTNSTSVGGIRNITGSEVRLDDGVFEVTLVHMPKDVFEVQEIATALLTGDYTTGLVDYFKTDQIELLFDEEVSWTLDGEYGGSWSEVVIEDSRQAIRMILTPPATLGPLTALEAPADPEAPAEEASRGLDADINLEG